MKRIFLFSMLLGLFAITGCKEKFDVAAPYKDITVVYGILNRQDTANYIRIEKAFLDQNKSAIDMSKVPDSSFYDSLKVELQETYNGNPTKKIQLRLVNLNDEGYPKDPAANSLGFFTNPSWAYKFTQADIKLNPGQGYEYTLIITNNQTGRVDQSESIGIVNNDSLQGGGSFYIQYFTNLNYVVRFSRIAPAYTYSITGNVPSNATMIEGHLIFNYEDSNVVSGQKTRHSADYLFSSVSPVTTDNQFKLEVQDVAIYYFIRDALGPAPQNIARLMDSCQIKIYAGSKELYTYQQVASGQNGGLTSDQIKPNYTNMKGENVLGVVGSRAYRVFNNAGIEDVTLDSMMVSPILSPLNIKGRTSD